jgi:hypothetical protein
MGIALRELKPDENAQAAAPAEPAAESGTTS